MVNKNTLNILNMLGIGADIDGLESFIINYEQASLMSDLSKYKTRYTILKDILANIKNNSIALSDDRPQLKEIEKSNTHDSLFILNPIVIQDKAYGINSNKLDLFKEHLNNAVDIISYMNIRGINIKATYLRGYLYKVYGIGNGKILLDLTNILKYKIPDNVKAFEQYKLVELRGKLTISSSDTKFKDNNKIIECEVIHETRVRKTSENLEAIFHSIETDDEDFNKQSEWDKIEFIENIDSINVVHHILMREIDNILLPQAVQSIDEYFEEYDTLYKYDDIVLKTDKLETCYNSKDSETDKVYESEIIKFSYSDVYNTTISKLDIKPVICNDKLTINSVILQDICDIDKYDLYKGNNVKFKVVEQSGILLCL